MPPVIESERLPGWPAVAAMIEDGAPQAIVAEGNPEVRLIVDGAHQRLTLRCESDDDLSPAEFDQLDQLEVRRSTADGDWIEVRTHQPDLFPFFVAFCGTVADEIQLEAASVRSALTRSLRLFRRLVRDTPALSAERQLGLLGELWVLSRLVTAKREAALDSWLGPNAEAHDFRWGDVELEVKATRRQQRHHHINGLDQLEASPDARLYLVSLQFAAAGPSDAGTTLAEAIAELRAQLVQLGQDAPFDAVLLDRFDLGPETEHRYTDRMKLRTEPRLIEIVDRTPRVLRPDVLAIDRDDMQRVLDADYLLDCEGLGVPDGSDAFNEIIP